MKQWMYPANSYAKQPHKRIVVESAWTVMLPRRGWNQRTLSLQRLSQSEARFIRLMVRSEVHSGGTNPTEGPHVTVEFVDENGEHITTHHVPVTLSEGM